MMNSCPKMTSLKGDANLMPSMIVLTISYLHRFPTAGLFVFQQLVKAFLK
jgi:hypothetical protein